MPRRMSCALTINAVSNRTKTATRRRIDTWTTLKVGDRLTLIEKGMGLPKGAKQVVLADVEVTDVRDEVLGLVDEDECRAEGFPDMSPLNFMIMWAASHGWTSALHAGPLHAIPCKRIEWRYLDAEESG